MTEKKQQIRDYLAITVGTILIAFAIKNIFDPVSMVTGGVSGAAIILKELWQVPLWLTNTVLNIPLFLAAFLYDGLAVYRTHFVLHGHAVCGFVCASGDGTCEGRYDFIGSFLAVFSAAWGQGLYSLEAVPQAERICWPC